MLVKVTSRVVLELAAILTRLGAASRFESRFLVALLPDWCSSSYLSFSLGVFSLGFIIPDGPCDSHRVVAT